MHLRDAIEINELVKKEYSQFVQVTSFARLKQLLILRKPIPEVTDKIFAMLLQVRNADYQQLIQENPIDIKDQKLKMNVYFDLVLGNIREKSYGDYLEAMDYYLHSASELTPELLALTQIFCLMSKTPKVRDRLHDSFRKIEYMDTLDELFIRAEKLFKEDYELLSRDNSQYKQLKSRRNILEGMNSILEKLNPSDDNSKYTEVHLIILFLAALVAVMALIILIGALILDCLMLFSLPILVGAIVIGSLVALAELAYLVISVMQLSPLGRKTLALKKNKEEQDEIKIQEETLVKAEMQYLNTQIQIVRAIVKELEQRELNDMEQRVEKAREIEPVNTSNNRASFFGQGNPSPDSETELEEHSYHCPKAQ